MIDNILKATEADSYTIYLSDSTENNFRTHLYPQYKANRLQKKPKHYEGLKYYLVTEEEAKITPEQEADDALGITQTGHNQIAAGTDAEFDSVICSIDKDLLQIPGNHYNFVKDEKRFVTPNEGTRHFYTQLLVGDVSDNIVGIRGIGPKKAEKAFEKCRSDDDFFKVVSELYEFDYCRIAINGILLKIRTVKDEIWTFPPAFQNVQPTMEDLLSYSQIRERENTPLSELTSQEKTGFQQLGL